MSNESDDTDSKTSDGRNISVCMRGCVYGNTLSTQSPSLEPLLLNDLLGCVSVCVVVYGVQRRNKETHHIHTHSCTPLELS